MSRQREELLRLVKELPETEAPRCSITCVATFAGSKQILASGLVRHQSGQHLRRGGPDAGPARRRVRPPSV